MKDTQRFLMQLAGGAARARYREITTEQARLSAEADHLTTLFGPLLRSGRGARRVVGAAMPKKRKLTAKQRMAISRAQKARWKAFRAAAKAKG